MPLQKTLHSLGTAITLGVSVTSSHAWEIFERQSLKLEEVCAIKSSIILDGKNICEISKNEGVEVSLDNGETWIQWWMLAILVLTWVTGTSMIWRKIQEKPSKKWRVPTELPVFTDQVGENLSVENTKKSIIDMLRNKWVVHLDFQFFGEWDNIYEYINFGFQNRYFQIGVEGLSWGVYFHWFDKPSKTINTHGEWQIWVPDFQVTIGMVQNFLEVLEMYPNNSLWEEVLSQ